MLSVVAAMLVVACSSSGNETNDAGDGGDDGAPENACGPAPWVHLRTGAASYFTKLPLSGATVTVDSCPASTFVSDNAGFWDVYVSSGKPFNPRIEAAGYVTSRSGESMATTDLLELGATTLYFPIDSKATLFPHITDTSPAILAVAFLAPSVQPNPNDPCTDRTGVTFSVVGHPEAIVTYYGGTSQQPMPDTSLQATGTLGSAEIGGIAASAAPVELVATKQGCAASFVSYPHTGKYLLENGVLTLAGAFMPPIPSP